MLQYTTILYECFTIDIVLLRLILTTWKLNRLLARQ